MENPCCTKEHRMGSQRTVPYQRTPLFRQISSNPQLRPKTSCGNPHQALTAYCLVLTGLDCLQPGFVRLPETWQPIASGDIRVLIRDFVQHTLVRYPVPAFMYKAWETDNDLHKQWFIHLGAGKNLRKAEGLPFEKPMTKMHAHHTCAAPSWMSIEQALRYGQVRSMDGDIRIAKAIATSVIGQNLDASSSAFWTAVIREILNMPDLPAHKIRAVIAKWHELFFVPQFATSAHGRIKQVIPDERMNPLHRDCLPDILQMLQPDPASLGLSSDEIAILAKPFPKMNDSWKHGLKKNRLLVGYDIRQLMNSADLIAEGKKQNHCVGTYTWSCRRGYTFIFVIRGAERAFHQTCLTIEVSRHKQIRQVKGPWNRTPNAQEKKVVQEWARLAGVKADCYDMRE